MMSHLHSVHASKIHAGCIRVAVTQAFGILYTGTVTIKHKPTSPTVHGQNAELCVKDDAATLATFSR